MAQARIATLLAVAITAFALVASASASTFTSPAGSTYFGTIHAESENFELHSKIGTFKCKSTLAVDIEFQGPPAKASLTTLHFSECNYAVTVIRMGELEIRPVGNGNATVFWTGGEFTVHGPASVNCLYKTSNTNLGTLTGSTSTGSTATLDFESTLIPRPGHNAKCGEVGELTGSYKITSPDYLGIEGESPFTSPVGTAYGGPVHGEAESIELHSEVASSDCKKATLGAAIEPVGTTSVVKAKVSSLSFSECYFPITVLQAGTLELYDAGSGNATVLWTGGEFTLDGPYEIYCRYKTSATDIGTLTGSTTTGSTATLDLETSLVPRTGGSALCGEVGELTGSYKITSPDYLGTDGPGYAAPFTSPSGSTYGGAIHAESDSFEFHSEVALSRCAKTTMAAVTESSVSATIGKFKITKLTFNNCEYPVTVLKAGELEVHSTGSGDATVTWTGGEFTIHGPFGLNCLFATSATDIGTLTGSTTTGSTATLDLESALIPRTGHSAWCNEFGELTGAFAFTSPDYLEID